MIKVKITKEHISKGERKHHCRCPIALALTDAGFTKVMVQPYAASTGETGIFSLCEEAEKFVRAFDAGNTVYPFVLGIGYKFS